MRGRLLLASVALGLVAAACAAPAEKLSTEVAAPTTTEFIRPAPTPPPTVATTTPTTPPTTTKVTTAAPAALTPPRPATGGTNCSPEYEGACVPAGVEDVDCAGGTGNGPYYVQEKRFRSVGSDPYGLDSDKDGIACES